MRALGCQPLIVVILDIMAIRTPKVKCRQFAIQTAEQGIALAITVSGIVFSMKSVICPRLSAKVLRFLPEQRFQLVLGRQEPESDTRVIVRTQR